MILTYPNGFPFLYFNLAGFRDDQVGTQLRKNKDNFDSENSDTHLRIRHDLTALSLYIYTHCIICIYNVHNINRYYN